MAGVDDQLVSGRSQLELLSNEEASRSVLISNVSAKLRREDIMIYFQKEKIGGGEVDNVFVLKDGKAVIVFEKPEVAERVMKGHHVLGGSELELKPYRPDKAKTPQVFSCVSARVHFGMFPLSFREIRNLLEKVKNKTGITWREDSDALLLNGMFDQVQNAHKYLQEYFDRRPYLQLAQKEEAYCKDTRNTKQNAAGFSSKVAKITDIFEFDVQPTLVKLLKQVYETTLQDMEKDFRLEIVWGDDERRVTIRPKENTQESLYRDGCDAFVCLYQKVHQDFRREVVEMENVNDEKCIQNAIRLVEAHNRVVIEKLNNQLFVYAEENDLKSSVKALKKQLELISTSNQTAARGGRSFNHDACKMTEQHQRDQPSLPNILQHTLSNGVKLSLRQGDITEEKVDAIVNPTNSRLHHGDAGVAAAIVRKGGRQILDDSWHVMSQRNAPLQVSEAVYTRSGYLPCRYVIHTVGPDWSANGKEASIPFLRRACLESLRLAVRLGLCSIALPAISSGSLGMPKDICAKAIFNAVEEYSSSIDAECSNLLDIRIVIIDHPTIEVFYQEFVKRYCSNDSHSSIDQERAHASATNSTGYPRSAKGALDNPEKNVGNKLLSVEVVKSMSDNDSEQTGTQNIKTSTLHTKNREHSVRLPSENGTNGASNTEEHSMERENQRAHAANLETKVKSSPSTNANQPEAGTNGVDKGTLKAIFLEETAEEDKSSVNTHFNKVQAGGITHPHAIKEADTADDDDGDSGDPNEKNVLDSEANASKASEAETRTSRSCTLTKGSTACIATFGNLSQVPVDKTSNQTDLDNSTTEPSITKVPMEFSDTSKSSAQSFQSHCSICQGAFRDPVYPSKCGHTFCKRCVDKAVATGTRVLMCNEEWCACQRNQPVGHMSWTTEKLPLPGHTDCETIAVTYAFPPGKQGWEHPKPGHPYEGLCFTAYLPNNAEGQAVCEMLKRAFDAGLLFTIGLSPFTGEDNQILWNGVEHKANRLGGPSNYGYPDPDYLGRVRVQLASKGIKDDTEELFC